MKLWKLLEKKSRKKIVKLSYNRLHGIKKMNRRKFLKLLPLAGASLTGAGSWAGRFDWGWWWIQMKCRYWWPLFSRGVSCPPPACMSATEVVADAADSPIPFQVSYRVEKVKAVAGDSRENATTHVYLETLVAERDDSPVPIDPFHDDIMEYDYDDEPTTIL